MDLTGGTILGGMPDGAGADGTILGGTPAGAGVDGITPGGMEAGAGEVLAGVMDGMVDGIILGYMEDTFIMDMVMVMLITEEDVTRACMAPVMHTEEIQEVVLLSGQTTDEEHFPETIE